MKKNWYGLIMDLDGMYRKLIIVTFPMQIAFERMEYRVGFDLKYCDTSNKL